MDNVVFHLGFTKSKYSAHQAVSHGMFLLNGKKHNIGSTILKIGDVISIRDNKHKAFKNIDERLKDVTTPG
jgi:small subunit ribosomal protein S4